MFFTHVVAVAVAAAVAVGVVVVGVAGVGVVAVVVPHTTFLMPMATNWCPRVMFYWLCAQKLPLVPCCYKLAVFL